MQAADKNTQDHLFGFAAGNHPQRQQSMTESLFDIGDNSSFKLGALSGLDRSDSSAPYSYAAPSWRSLQLLPNN